MRSLLHTFFFTVLRHKIFLFPESSSIFFQRSLEQSASGHFLLFSLHTCIYTYLRVYLSVSLPVCLIASQPVSQFVSSFLSFYSFNFFDFSSACSSPFFLLFCSPYLSGCSFFLLFYFSPLPVTRFFLTSYFVLVYTRARIDTDFRLSSNRELDDEHSSNNIGTRISQSIIRSLYRRTSGILGLHSIIDYAHPMIGRSIYSKHPENLTTE